MPAKARLSQAAVEDRRQDVLKYVVERGEIRIDDLAAHFGLSLMTMHRDLDDLAGRDLLRKERGRAVAFPALTMETATRFREGAHREVKSALCAAAARRIRPGSTLLIDDSTTLYPLAGILAEIDGLTVVTNSVGLAQRLSSASGTSGGPARSGPEVTLLGGQYQSDFNSCTGREVTRGLSRIHADLALMSATAVHGGRLFHPLPEFVEVKEAMLGAATGSLLLADHSKFGKTATYCYGDAALYEAVITDSGTEARELAAVRELGVEVETVPAEPSGS
ncbi:DeoR/GlpR family DNA-binding transcription regulator [Streptomyces purpurogeneiscleroticus]|uniref:DeoR/GlpR family DNA-binding transcription regulator n=1 Tax=Streptomyces purpurogeneiscleroticus TaxID=68259 RepID=UPI001CBC15AC|nr:DeoR/GlpR family DNA-binding transcription regulator [Streptomyces purpurogeneiscleroticus]MBZ4020461.1 DeoR family transcriptional regulator [Streptomyces purpurogeneiscleroticus]